MDILPTVINGIEDLSTYMNAPQTKQGVHHVLYKLGDSQSLLHIDSNAKSVLFIDKFDRPMGDGMRNVILDALPQTQIIDVSREKRLQNIHNPEGFSASSNTDPKASDWVAQAAAVLEKRKSSAPQEVAASAAAKAAPSWLKFWGHKTESSTPKKDEIPTINNKSGPRN